MQNIIYLTGPCSSGKTYQIMQLISTGSKLLNPSKRILFVTPSKKLSKEIFQGLSQLDFKCRIVNQDHIGDNATVGQTLKDEIEFNKDRQNVCLILTQQAYDSINNNLFTQYGYQVVFDESLSKFKFFEFTMDTSIPFGRIFNFAKNSGKLTLKTEFKPAHFSLIDPFNDIRSHILNQKRDVYALKYQDDNYICKYESSGKNYQEITVVSYPSENYFPDGSIILTANKENCDYYNLHKENLNIKEMKMDSRLKDKKIKIHTFTDKRINSTKLKAKNKAFIESVFNYVKKEMHKGLIFKNKTESETDKNGNIYYPFSPEPFKLPESNEDWIDIPANVCGQNAYKHAHAIFLLGTLNPPPKVIKELRERLNLSKKDLYKTTVVETYHQMIMRTSLRDPDSQEPVNVFMIDLETAEYLKTKFEFDYDFDVEIIHHEDFDTIKKPHANDHNPLSKQEYNRIATIVDKALKGKIKSKYYERKILEISKNGKEKRNPSILALDEQHILDTGKKL